MKMIDIKLGCLIVHVEEYLSKDGYAVDRLQILSSLEDPDIKEFIRSIDPVLLPVKRNAGKKS